MRQIAAILVCALALVGCTDDIEPPAPDTGSRDIQEGDGSSDAGGSEVPRHCDIEILGKSGARNVSLDRNDEELNPRECDFVRDCEGMRTVHWCRTEGDCSETHACQPGGSWRIMKRKGGWVPVFECGTDFYCPAD